MPQRNPEAAKPTVAKLETALARAQAERDEALAQQAAMAEVLGVINASSGDPAPVFDAILERAIRLCDAVQGVIWRIGGQQNRVAAARGLPPGFIELLQESAESGTNPVLPRIIAGERLIQFVNPEQEDFYRTGNPVAMAAFAAGIRSLIWVALTKDDAPIGAFAISRREVRPFSASEIGLLQSFAAQAVIAIENARLITETREALAQQTATAEVLGVINSSPGDLAPVFDSMLERAMRLCEATFGTLWTWDGECMTAAAVRGASDEYTAFLLKGPHPPSPIAHQPLLHGASVVHLDDIAVSEGYQSGSSLARAVVELGGVRTLLAVSLRKDTALIGVFSIYRDEVRPFTDKQIALLQNFAAQAVIAMENARLLTETREALEQQTATAEVLGVINSSPGDLMPVFDAMLGKAMRLCEANFGFLSTYDGKHFNAVALHGLPQTYVREYLHGPYLPGPGTTHDRLVKGEPVVHVPNLAIDQADSPRRRAVVEVLGVRSILAVPLHKDGMLVGAIHVFRREVRPFTDQQITLLQSFAAQAVIAMENARLITETREALAQQTATAEVLQVINASPGELAPVFDAMLEKALRLCGAAFGILVVMEEGQARTAAAHGLPPALAAWRRDNPVVSQHGTLLARILAGEPFIHTLDLKDDEFYRRGEPLRRANVDLGGARTSLYVPLLKDQNALGTIHIYRQEVRPFSEKQIALLQNFAAQAVIAMENARLLGELRARTEEVAELNRGLEARVAAQVEELGRVGRLRQFLAPQLAELVVSQGEGVLESHRREIVVVFCDLRGYTGFSETAEPEEVIEVLREYHAALGPLVGQFEGTVDQFSGDGVMVFFNDPVPCPNPAERAVDMAMAMRTAAAELMAAWRRRGHVLGFGVGIAQGYATLGQIGFAERVHYTAIGTVCNLASRLCAEAQPGQILVSQRVATAVEDAVRLEEIGNLALKGLSQAVAVYNVVGAA